MASVACAYLLCSTLHGVSACDGVRGKCAADSTVADVFETESLKRALVGFIEDIAILPVD